MGQAQNPSIGLWDWNPSRTKTVWTHCGCRPEVSVFLLAGESVSASRGSSLHRCMLSSRPAETKCHLIPPTSFPGKGPKPPEVQVLQRHPQGTEPGLKCRVCVLNCRPATSENLLYTKDCTNKAHITLLMPFSDGIPVSFWRTKENEAKTGQVRVTRLRRSLP